MNVVTAIRPDTGHHLLEAEQLLLGALMLNDRLTPIVMRAGGMELFFIPLHAAIYEAIEQRANSGELVSPVVIKSALQGSHEPDEVGGPAYIAHRAFASVSGDRDVTRGMVELLVEHARKRAIAEAQVGLLSGDMPAHEIALQLERQIVAAEFASQGGSPYLDAGCRDRGHRPVRRGIPRRQCEAGAVRHPCAG